MKLLLIEDNRQVSDFVLKGLTEAGHVADHAETGRDGLFLAVSERYDAMILDRLLPGGVDGLGILDALRRQGNHTPVLILSALSDVEERIRGLKAGGDDYLAKPFVFGELLARLEALVRRGHSPGTVTSLAVGDLTLDRLSRRVTRGERRIDLQPREFQILDYLMCHSGQVVTRTMLLESVWDYHFDPQTNVVDVHIGKLRRKIDGDSPHPLIRTVRNAGYMIHAGD